MLEAIRYVLDRMPDPGKDKERYRAIDTLLQSNLGGGSARVEIETADGASYAVVRGVGEGPLVTNDEGAPVDINIGKGIIFGVDIYSQNQIEDIANDFYFQLQLIDKFIHREVAELERRIRETTKEIDANATKIARADDVCAGEPLPTLPSTHPGRGEVRAVRQRQGPRSASCRFRAMRTPLVPVLRSSL